MIWSLFLRVLLPILKVLGIYGKGRIDQYQRDKAAAEAKTLKTVGKINEAIDSSHAGGGSWHDRLPPKP